MSYVKEFEELDKELKEMRASHECGIDCIRCLFDYADLDIQVLKDQITHLKEQLDKKDKELKNKDRLMFVTFCLNVIMISGITVVILS